MARRAVLRLAYRRETHQTTREGADRGHAGPAGGGVGPARPRRPSSWSRTPPRWDYSRACLFSLMGPEASPAGDTELPRKQMTAGQTLPSLKRVQRGPY